MLPATRREVALHEFRHAVAGSLALNLFHPDLLDKATANICVTGNDTGECFFLGLADHPDVEARIHRLASVGPLTLMPPNALAKVVKSTTFAQDEYLSSRDLELVDQLGDPANVQRVLTATWAFVRGIEHEDAILTLILDACAVNKGLEIPVSVLCRQPRVDAALNRMKHLLREWLQ
jgi:hypothetical protein